MAGFPRRPSRDLAGLHQAVWTFPPSGWRTGCYRVPTRRVRHLVLLRRRSRILAPVHPNVGIEADYRHSLDKLVEEMNRSLIYWISAQWRRNEPALASDEAPAAGLRRMMRDLRRRWESRFDDASKKLADHFVQDASRRSQKALEKILDDAGMTVQFRLTPTVRGVINATIGDNVSLIKSIASEHLTDVEGIVLRSVQQGRDLHYAARAIEDQFGVSKRRAALIARDQNNKMTAAITRVRQQELGINKARWLHSGGGKHPRPEHVAFSAGRLGGPFYDVSKGAYLEGKWTWPGIEINCRCVSQPVVEGFS